MTAISIPLYPSRFTTPEILAEGAGIRVTAFRYPTGVEALRLETRRGHVIVLPFLGQMIWEAVFDGRNLTMGSAFRMPRAGASILETYGAFAYHAGVLRNGTPGPDDTHVLHGEMPTARMDSAHLTFGTDARGDYAEISSSVEYIMGFGPHYHATPRLRLRGDSGLIDIEMTVRNMSAHPMELMYMLHANFAFVADAVFHQPMPFDPGHTSVRREIPSHVTPSAAFMDLLRDLETNPARMATLSEPALYSPEQVFYLSGPGTDAAGYTRLVMELPGGDAFSVAYRPSDLPHCVRWILNDGDAQVAAFALPSTCQPEGYTREKAKGHVRLLSPGESAQFPVTIGYLNRTEAAPAITSVRSLQKGHCQ